MSYYTTVRAKIKVFPVCSHLCGQSGFWPGFAAWKNPANARVARGSGLWLFPSWIHGESLPKQARYQLRYTRIFSFRHYTMAQGEKSKIFLSVVIYVVKAAFQPGLLTRHYPANDCVSIAWAVWSGLSRMKSSPLPPKVCTDGPDYYSR